MSLSTPTLVVEYSPTLFSKKFVVPLEADHSHPFKRVVSFVVSMAVEGDQELASTKFNVLHIMAEFILMSVTGSVSTKNSILMLTALLKISTMHALRRRFISLERSRHAKLQYNPSHVC